jgi:hypothetical protein
MLFVYFYQQKFTCSFWGVIFMTPFVRHLCVNNVLHNFEQLTNY